MSNIDKKKVVIMGTVALVAVALTIGIQFAVDRWVHPALDKKATKKSEEKKPDKKG